MELNTTRPKVGIDIDDVLSKTTHFLIEVLWKRGHSVPKYEDFTHFSTYEVVWFPIKDKTEVADFYTELLSHPDSIDYLETVSGSKEALALLKEHFELHAITARSIATKVMTELWIDKHFPWVFTTIDFLGECLDLGHTSKGKVCRELGIVAMIDDNIDYALSITWESIPCALLAAPWNKSRAEQHPLVHRVNSWNEALPWFMQHTWKSL